MAHTAAMTPAAVPAPAKARDVVSIFDHIFDKLPRDVSLFDTKEQREERQRQRVRSGAVGANYAGGATDVQDLVAESTAEHAAATVVPAAAAVPGHRLEMELDENDEATKAAMTFALNEEYVPLGSGDAATAAATAAAAAVAGNSGARVGATAITGDPYLGLVIPDDGRIYRGVCRMFHQERGFGFVEPLLLGDRMPTPGGERRFPDVYFTREDVVVPAALGGTADASERARRDRAATNPLYAICIGEVVEFKIITNRAAATRSDGGGRFRAVEITGIAGAPVKVQTAADRCRGVIRYWSPGQQYGFLQPTAGGRDVFFHSSAIFWAPLVPPQRREVEVGFSVEYTPVSQDAKGAAAGGGGRGFGGGSDDRGKQVAFAVTDAQFAPIDPAVIPRAQAPEQRPREKERKRAREDDDDADARAAPVAPVIDAVLLSAAEDESYATW